MNIDFKFQMNLSQQEIGIILKALSKLPYEEVAGVIANISKEYKQQQELLTEKFAEKQQNEVKKE